MRLWILVASSAVLAACVSPNTSGQGTPTPGVSPSPTASPPVPDAQIQIASPTADEALSYGVDADKSFPVHYTVDHFDLAIGHVALSIDGNSCDDSGLPASANSEDNVTPIAAKPRFCGTPAGAHTITLALHDDQHNAVLDDAGVAVSADVDVVLSNPLFFTFDSDLDGWSLGHDQGGTAVANRGANEGNASPGIHLDGVDPVADTTPNAWVSRAIVLPPTTTSIAFETRASAATDGNLRVRIFRENNTQDVRAYEALMGDTWLARSEDISSHAGESVTIYFDQDDDGEGNGEHRYIDNVEIVY